MSGRVWRNPSRMPQVLFQQVAGRLNRRQLYHIGCGVFRLRATDGRLDADLVAAVEVVERYADDRAAEAEFVAARDRVRETWAESDGVPMTRRQVDAQRLGDLFALNIRTGAWWVVVHSFGGTGRRYAAARAAACAVIHEIAGNPFRPWKSVPEAMGGGLVQPDGETVFPSSAARAIAAGIAADQAFDRLPVLADALEDSGVTDAEMLEHCRRPGGHLRGCWAVDVVLGRG